MRPQKATDAKKSIPKKNKKRKKKAIVDLELAKKSIQEENKKRKKKSLVDLELAKLISEATSQAFKIKEKKEKKKKKTTTKRGSIHKNPEKNINEQETKRKKKSPSVSTECTISDAIDESLSPSISSRDSSI